MTPVRKALEPPQITMADIRKLVGGGMVSSDDVIAAANLLLREHWQALSATPGEPCAVLVVGATYQSQNGPVVYRGLDHYCGETTYKFEEPGNPRPRYIREQQLADFLRRAAPAPAQRRICEDDGSGEEIFNRPDLVPARPDTAEATLADLIREYANDLRRNSSGSDDYPWDWAKATADYLEVLIDRSSTQREVLCEGAYYLTRGNKNNLRQLVGPLASSTDPEFPWKATVYGSIHRWKSDGTSAESPVRDIVGDPVYAWPNETAEARLREALDLLQLQQRGRAKALRLLDQQCEVSDPATLAQADACEECGNELKQALSTGDEAKESEGASMKMEGK